MQEEDLTDLEKAELRHLGKVSTPEERERAEREVRRPVRHRIAEFYLTDILEIPIDKTTQTLSSDFFALKPPFAYLDALTHNYHIVTDFETSFDRYFGQKENIKVPIYRTFNPHENLEDAMYVVHFLIKKYDMEFKITHPWKQGGNEFDDQFVPVDNAWLVEMNVPLPPGHEEWETLSMYEEHDTLLSSINSCLFWLHKPDYRKKLWMSVKEHKKNG